MLRTIIAVALIALAFAAPGCISVKTEGPAPTGYAQQSEEGAVTVKACFQCDFAGGF